MKKRYFLKNMNIGTKTMGSHLLVALTSIVLLTVLLFLFSMQYTENSVKDELSRQATLIARWESMLTQVESIHRGQVVGIYQSLTNSEVFFINREGEAMHLRKYLPQNDDPVAENDNEFSVVQLFDAIDQQFVADILNGKTVTAVRQFGFADGVIVCSGAPMYDENQRVIGGVILTQPVAVVQAVGRQFGMMVTVAGGISILLALLLAVGQTRTRVRPILEMTRVARRMTEGDYAQSVEIRTGDEIGELGHAFNILSVRLEEVIETLRQERDRLELVIGSIGEGILAVDGNMNVVHSNLSFLEMMELESMDGLKDDSRADVRMLLDHLKDTMESGNRSHRRWENPSDRAILSECSAITDPEGRRVGAVCLLADVSESLRLEKMRRDYVANISHELRTPLTGIRGMIEPLIDGCMDTPEECQQCYSVIHKETVRLEKLVGEMLDISRLQDGRIKVDVERMELRGILEAAVRSMKPHAREGGIHLKLETDGSLLACIGNEARITQVLVILMDNAIDFTPCEGEVTVYARTVSGGVEVGVRDTGCGIEPKDLPFIWERFYKADRSRMRTKGTGLGLSIAKLVIELMDGTISVKSEPGRGSEFFFFLPGA